MALLTSIPPPCDELLTVASSTLCNLLLEFSPAKEPILEQGAVQLLCSLTNRPEPSLKLNGKLWLLSVLGTTFCLLIYHFVCV